MTPEILLAVPLVTGGLARLAPRVWLSHVVSAVGALATAIIGLALAWRVFTAGPMSGGGFFAVDALGAFVVAVVVVIVGVAAAWAFFSAPDVANAPGPKDPTYVSDRTGEMMGQAAAAVATAMGVKHVGTALDLMRRSDPVSQEGLGRIDQHLRRLGASDDPPNAAMLQRLREGKRGREDLSFYRHELHEASLMEKGADSRSAHLRTLEWQGIPYKPGYEKELYSREVIERFADRFNPAARQ